MRSGYLNVEHTVGSLRHAGSNSGNWSSWGVGEINAYYLAFYADGVGPSHGPNARYHAFPLRCLSTVLGMWERWNVI